MKAWSPLLLALLLAITAIANWAQIPTFSAKTEEVRINVLVTDHGKPVLGLTPSDFEVLDNGIEQQIEFLAFEQIPVDVIMTLDVSESVSGVLLERLKSAGRSLLEALKRDDRAALVTFSRYVVLGSPLTTDFGLVKAALENTKPYGDTSAIDATYAGLTIAESTSGRPLLIVFSDGLDTSSWLTREAVINAAKRGQTVVYAVTAGQLLHETFLRDLAELTGGSVYEVDSKSSLDAVFLEILSEFRQRYLVTYSPRGVSKDGWHRLTVRIKDRNVKVKARPGYMMEASAITRSIIE